MDKSYLSEEERRIQRMRPFNILQADERKFAQSKGLSVGEYTVRAVGVRKAKGTDPLSLKAGDGNWGFSTKKSRNDNSKFEPTVDGTGLKKARATIVSPKKMPCRLATSAEVRLASADPVVLAERRLVSKKAKRAGQRNRRAKYRKQKYDKLV